jgi:hypothetical protein
MRDNMIVNLSGLQGHAMGADLNIEHQIGTVKVCKDILLSRCYYCADRSVLVQTLFASKGLHASWDRLGDASAVVDYVQKVKKCVGTALGTSHRGSKHTTPDTSNLVWRVADKVKNLNLQTFRHSREGNEDAKPFVDILLEGEKKLKSASLKTFNKKVHQYLAGESVEAEVDVLPLCALRTDGEEE